jgi:hypothetical protein
MGMNLTLRFLKLTGDQRKIKDLENYLKCTHNRKVLGSNPKPATTIKSIG